jgi:predicted DCC family thiol-disulfide oxidoreductase YuxK
VTATATTYPLTIYYDASCPLCTREIALLREFDATSALTFIDCSPEQFAGIDGYSRAEMMKLIHARDAGGRWLIGPAVFAAAYSVCDLRLFAKLWGAPVLQPLWRQ